MDSEQTKEINTAKQLNNFRQCEVVNLNFSNTNFTSVDLLNSKFFDKFGSHLKTLKIFTNTLNWKWEVVCNILKCCKSLEKLEFVLDKCPYEFPEIDLQSIEPLKNFVSFKLHVVFIEDLGPDDEDYEENEPMFVKPINFPSNFNKFMKGILQYVPHLKELEITSKDYYLDKDYLSWIHDYIWHHHAELFPNIPKEKIPTEFPNKIAPFRMKSILESESFETLTEPPWILLHQPDNEVTTTHFQQFLGKLSTATLKSKSPVTKLTLTCPVYEFIPQVFPSNHSFGTTLNHLILQYWNGPMEFLPTLTALKELELHESDLNQCIFYKEGTTDIESMNSLFGGFKDLDVMFSNCRGSFKISNPICQAFEEKNITLSVTD